MISLRKTTIPAAANVLPFFLRGTQLPSRIFTRDEL